MFKFLKFLFVKIKYTTKYALASKNTETYYREMGYKYLGEREFYDLVIDHLNKGNPLCVGKIGGNECDAMVSQIVGYNRYIEKSYDRLCTFAGFFPKKYDAICFKKYYDVQKHAISSLDVIIWYRKIYEELLLSRFASAKLCCIQGIGSWTQKVPWTEALRNRKVVVVHPYAELIELQYLKREKIHKNQAILPPFQLRVVKAVQSIADSDIVHENWFDALNGMFAEIVKEDFDIALIGCGAYGLPLASMVKDYGKIGIHMGGDLQMLFGIRGKRWDDMPGSAKWYNDDWVRPGEEYKVKGFESVEDGCYW